MQLKRNIDNILFDWKNSHSRKPILLRGARQVGKSTSVKAFAKHFEYFLEVNFETEKDIHVFFEGNINGKLQQFLRYHHHSTLCGWLFFKNELSETIQLPLSIFSIFLMKKSSF